MKKVKKFLRNIMVMIFLPIVAYSIEVVVANLKGNVVISDNKGVNWIAVSKGQMITENQKIKTLSKSSALLLFSDGTTIALSENTEVSIKELVSNIVINLEEGRVKSKVKPLKLGQKFEVRTSVSVASIRGTTFIVGYSNGVAELLVEEGKVLWGEIKTQLQQVGQEQIANQQVESSEGTMVEVNAMEKITANEQGLGQKSGITPQELENYNNNFDIKLEETKNEEGKNQQEIEEKKKEEVKQEIREQIKSEITALRQEIKEFIQNAKNDNQYIGGIVQETKSNDFETGRSLTDAHGNLTRVEQIITRPEPNTVEFINITKRENYRYDGRQLFGYEIKEKARIDLFNFKVEFNMSLPTKINELPAFIADKKDDFYPKRISFKIANGGDKSGLNKIDKIEGEVVFEKVEKEYVDWKNGWREIRKETKLEGTSAMYISNGTEKYKIDTDYKGNLPEGRELEDGGVKLYVWAEKPIPILKKDLSGNYSIHDILWLQTENYVINNSGQILDENSVKNVADPFTFLKQVAFESVVFVRKDDNGKPGAAFFNRNIDLVVTPDIVIAMAKSMLPSLTKMNFSESK